MNFVILEPPAKVLSMKFGHAVAFRKNFLHEMVTSYQSLKVFSLESFLLAIRYCLLHTLITFTALVQEDFDRLDYSMARVLSSQLLQEAPQPPQNAGTKPTIIGAVVGIVIVLFMMILIGVVGFILYRHFK